MRWSALRGVGAGRCWAVVLVGRPAIPAHCVFFGSELGWPLSGHDPRRSMFVVPVEVDVVPSLGLATTHGVGRTWCREKDVLRLSKVTSSKLIEPPPNTAWPTAFPFHSTRSEPNGTRPVPVNCPPVKLVCAPTNQALNDVRSDVNVSLRNDVIARRNSTFSNETDIHRPN